MNISLYSRFALTALVLGASCLPMAAQASKEPVAALRLDGKKIVVDPDIPSYNPAPPMTGELNIVGSGGLRWQGRIDTLIDLWCDIFHAAHPSVVIHKALYSSGSGFLALTEDDMQVGVSTREPMPSDVVGFRNKDYKPLEIPVAGGSYSYDEGTPSIVVIVNHENPLKGMTLAQLDAVFSSTRKRGYKEDITTWGQLGLTGDWANKPIHMYGLQQPDGIPNYLIKRVLLGGTIKSSLTEEHADAKMKGMDKLVKSVQEDRYGITYVNRYNATGAWDINTPILPNLKILGLSEDEKGPFSNGSYEDVMDRTYPLSRLIYLYANQGPKKPVDPLAKEFIRVALSKEGQEAVNRTVYMPLGWAMLRPSLEQMDAVKEQPDAPK